jgi:hypothetical protein
MGADFGPLTLDGQWWRMLTALFVHIDLLTLNMAVLVGIGTVIEAAVGTPLFVAVYLAAGVGGARPSLAWHPFQISARRLRGAHSRLAADAPPSRDAWRCVGAVEEPHSSSSAQPRLRFGAAGDRHGGARRRTADRFRSRSLPLQAPRPSMTAAIRGVGRRPVVATGAIIIGPVVVLPKPDDVQPDVARFAGRRRQHADGVQLIDRSVEEFPRRLRRMIRVIRQDLLPVAVST